METLEKNLTRGGEFIVRETDCNDVFTPEDFTEEQKMMKDAVHDFAEKEIWSKKSEFESKNAKIKLSFLRKVKKC